MNTFWIILTFIDVIFLVLYFNGGRNAVWGGLTMGAIVGLIVAGGFALLTPDGFEWLTVAKWAIGCSLYGAVTEIFAIFDRPKPR